MRECKRHGWTEHALYRSGKANPWWRCRTCVAEAVTRRHHRVRRILVAEAGGCCAVCGYDRCIINLHFHHVDPRQKEFALTSARGKGLEARRREARKCVLVCANCHGEIEAGMIGFPPPGAKYGARADSAPEPASRNRPRSVRATPPTPLRLWAGDLE